MSELIPTIKVTFPNPPGPRGPQGIQGERGEQGERGPAGPPGDIASALSFEQDTPSAEWTITHGFDRRPSVTIIDSAGSEVEGDVFYVDTNTVRVSFSAPFAGKAYLI